jgi:hypothetical protein
MKNRLLFALLLGAALLQNVSRAAESDAFSFAVIAPPIALRADEALREAVEDANAHDLAFVVANAIKAADEPCTDKLYLRRKALLQDAKHGLIVSLAASDWVDCKSANGKPAEIAKLNRLRELFFTDDFSLGIHRIPVIRQSRMPKYRDFVENARWEIGQMMFVTVNIPANNNHYVLDAGRNSEFEDRLVANREWLNRAFASAARKKLPGIVLFCDGNPLTEDERNEKRDGYAETRRHIKTLAEKFSGKILIVHNAFAGNPGAARIQWQANLGELAAVPLLTKITVRHSGPDLLIVTSYPTHDD